MRKLVFAKKINGTDETGLIDIAKNPPELYCLCEEDKANEILNLNKAPVIGEFACPFCNDTGFDKPGLKYHIENYCKEYGQANFL